MGMKRIGPNTWQYDIHVAGSPERPRGIFEGKRFEAEAFYLAKKIELRKASSLKFQTVGEILARYKLDHYHTTARYKRDQAAFDAVVKGVGHFRLKDFNKPNFRAWLDRKKCEEYKKGKFYRPDTLNKFIVIAHAAFEWARDNYHYPENPLHKFEKFPPENRQFWVYSKGQVNDIINRARGTGYYRLFHALKYWPCRISELITLRGQDIQDGYISIRDEHSKTGKGRALPISAALLPELAGIPKDCPHVFCTAAGKSLVKRARLQKDNLLRWLHKLKEPLQLPGATLHGFRRTTAVRLLEAGVDLSIVANMTGHADLSTLTDRYLPISQLHTSGAMLKLEQSLDGIVDKADTKTEAA